MHFIRKLCLLNGYLSKKIIWGQFAHGWLEMTVCIRLSWLSFSCHVSELLRISVVKASAQGLTPLNESLPLHYMIRSAVFSIVGIVEYMAPQLRDPHCLA